MKRASRDAEALDLYRRGQSVARLAARFGVSERTVYRILRRNK